MSRASPRGRASGGTPAERCNDDADGDAMIRTRGVERANEDATMDDDALARGFVDLGASIAGRGERAVDAKRRSSRRGRRRRALGGDLGGDVRGASGVDGENGGVDGWYRDHAHHLGGAFGGVGVFFIGGDVHRDAVSVESRELADQETSSNGVFNVMRKDVTRFLTTILIGTTFSGIMATALITEAALRMSAVRDDDCPAALTVVMLVFTEIAPKSVAVQHAKVVARFIAKPIFWLSLILYPLGRTCQILVNAMFSVFGEDVLEPFVSEEELKLVLAGATKSGGWRAPRRR